MSKSCIKTLNLLILTFESTIPFIFQPNFHWFTSLHQHQINLLFILPGIHRVNTTAEYRHTIQPRVGSLQVCCSFPRIFWHCQNTQRSNRIRYVCLRIYIVESWPIWPIWSYWSCYVTNDYKSYPRASNQLLIINLLPNISSPARCKMNYGFVDFILIMRKRLCKGR